MSLWQTSSSFLSYRWELLHSHGNLCAIAGSTAFIVFLLLSVSSFCFSSIAAPGFITRSRLLKLFHGFFYVHRSLSQRTDFTCSWLLENRRVILKTQLP